MVSKMTRETPVSQELVGSKTRHTTIAPQARQAWERIPQRFKVEIVEEFKKPSVASVSNTKTVKVGPKTLSVRRMSSGFQVVYEPGSDRDTIVSVLTAREARVAED
jgi:hypothetical protein